jgi:hypothetical protein
LKSILIENNKFTLPFRVGIIQNCKWGFSPTLTQWNKKRISSVKKHWVSGLILLKSILIENNKFTLPFRVGIIQNCKWGFSPTLTQWNKKRISSVKKHWVSGLILLKSILT